MFGKGGFARSVLPDDSDKLPGIDRQADLVQRPHRTAIDVGQIVDLDQRRSGSPAPARDSARHAAGGPVFSSNARRQMQRSAYEGLRLIDVAGMRIDAQRRQHQVEPGRTDTALGQQAGVRQHLLRRPIGDYLARRA